MVNVFFDGFRRSNRQIRIFSNSIGFVLKRQVLVTSRKGEIPQGHPTSIFGKYLFGRRFEI